MPSASFSTAVALRGEQSGDAISAICLLLCTPVGRLRPCSLASVRGANSITEGGWACRLAPARSLRLAPRSDWANRP
jgi:hypothetical protein